MAYGKIKADAIIYDNSGSDVEKTISSLAAAAPTASPTFTGDVTLTGAAANVVFDASDNALEFADNAKATFGASGDLAIYHNGSHSKIEDTGTGKLWLLGSAVLFSNAAGDESLAEFTEDAGCTLRYNNGVKLATSNTGVTVTGTVTDDKGNVRDIPNNSKTGAYTLVVSDAGKVVDNTTGGWTIPASVFSAGHTVTLLNNSGSAQNITASALTYLYNTVDGANIKASTIAVGARGMATIWFGSGATGYIQSAALTVS